MTKALTDAVTQRHPAVLQLQHANRNAVEVEHNIGAFVVLAIHRHLFGNSKVVQLRVPGVDQLDGYTLLPRRRFYWNAIVKEAVDLAIVFVKRAVRITGLNAQFMDGFGTLHRRVSVPQKIGREQRLLNIAVPLAILPVAERAVAKLFGEQGKHAVLCFAFWVADGGQAVISCNNEELLCISSIIAKRSNR